MEITISTKLRLNIQREKLYECFKFKQILNYFWQNRDRDKQQFKYFLLSQNYVKWAPDVGFTLFKALNSLESHEKKEFNVRT